VCAALAAAAALSTGCRQDMHDQPRYKTFAESDFFQNGQAARPEVPGTVSRVGLHEDKVFQTGIGADGKFVDRLPVPFDRALVDRGRERFNVFCSPCHDRTGSGRGMIVQRGYKAPETYHTDRLRAQPVGFFFDVMTKGFGQMPSYAAQVPAGDRWAIAAYIRVLQFSQHAPVADLSSADLQSIEAAPSKDRPAGSSAPGDPEPHPEPGRGDRP
jgi:mono/diheme cytochrome c family protein